MCAGYRDTIISHVDEWGALIHYDGLVEDITERKELEQRFWHILESAPDAMLVVDEQGQITLANAQAERMFGYMRQELLQQPIERLIPDGSRAGPRRPSPGIHGSSADSA